jgi:hypothetical protein
VSDSTQGAFRGALATALETTSPGAASLASLLRRPDASLPLPPAHDRTVWDRATGTVDAAAVRDVLHRAAADLDTPWGVPLASAASRVHRDGDRESWESVAFARQRRLSRAALAAAVTLDDPRAHDHWLDEVADGVTLLCEQSSWCWPAHDDTMSAHGSVLATVTDPFLDLGAGEAAAQLAWIDQLLGAQLDVRYPGVRTRIRHEVRTRVIDPFLLRRDWHWLGLDGDVHNWNPWIHGNVLVCALRLLDAPHEHADRERSVALVIEGLDRYVTSLPADGAIDEGYAYWWNGACRALEALDILAHATGGALDATALIVSLRETVAFPHRMHLGGDWYLNLADGQARPPRDQPWHALHRAAVRVGDDAARAHAASYRDRDRAAATEDEGLGRLLRGITDPEWLAASPARPPLPREVWLPSTQVLVARQAAGSPAGLTVAAKGGHNAEHHNHNDVGSFLVASDGVPVIVDAGRPTYTLATFGPDRYSIWTMQSSWHNVPEIRGVAQSPGAHAAASAVSALLSDAATSLSLDIAAAYDVRGLASWRRTVRLDREHGVVAIDDAWDLEPDADTAETTEVRLLLAGGVELGDGEALVTPLQGAPAVRIRWPAGIPAILTVRPLGDPMLSDVWGQSLTRLDLDVTGRDSIPVTVHLDRRKGGDGR